MLAHGELAPGTGPAANTHADTARDRQRARAPRFHCLRAPVCDPPVGAILACNAAGLGLWRVGPASSTAERRSRGWLQERETQPHLPYSREAIVSNSSGP